MKHQYILDECQYGNEKIGKHIISQLLIRFDSNIRNGSDNGDQSGHPNQNMHVAIIGRQVKIHNYFGEGIATQRRGIVYFCCLYRNKLFIPCDCLFTGK